MISFNYEIEFSLKDERKISKWISGVIDSEGFDEGDLTYFFCDDNKLLQINKVYLNHDNLTDIISFDYTVGKQIHGDLYISVERVAENAKSYSVDFFEELKRVMVHGILHYCGYDDKSKEDIKLMRSMEDQYLVRYNWNK